MSKDTVELGDRVKDSVTGLSGIAMGITRWLFGCERLHIQPETFKDGKASELFTVDLEQALVIKKHVIKGYQGNPPHKKETARPPQGPRPDCLSRGDFVSR